MEYEVQIMWMVIELIEMGNHSWDEAITKLAGDEHTTPAHIAAIYDRGTDLATTTGTRI